MPAFAHDGLSFRFVDQGRGIPFFFQHGLGGSVEQPRGLFSPPPGVRVISFDCRGHGETRPLGPPAKLGFSSFAEDLGALMDHLDIPRAVVGGISMGAGVALSFALRFPARVLGLVLVRNAWLDQPFPVHLHVYPVIARLIRAHGSEGGQARFEQSREYTAMLDVSPDCARSLLGQFTGPRAEETVAKLERIPRDCPSSDRVRWRAICTPTLVLANRRDPIHPYVFSEEIAAAIPGAQLGELTPKSVDAARHADELQDHVSRFFDHHFAKGDSAPC